MPAYVPLAASTGIAGEMSLMQMCAINEVRKASNCAMDTSNLVCHAKIKDLGDPHR